MSNMQTLGILCVIVLCVFTASRWRPLRPVFSVIPAVVWLYFVPMIASNVGVLPREAELYDWMSTYLLLFALFLLTLSIDLKLLKSVGPTAAAMMMVSTLSIAIGVVIAFAVTRSVLPVDGWQGMSLLSASWIGGSSNMMAMQQSLGADISIFGPIIVADTLISYGWLSIVILLAGFQTQIDSATRARLESLDSLHQTFEEVENSRRPPQVADLMLVVSGAMLVAVVGRELSNIMSAYSNFGFFTPSVWAILFVVSLGICLSFTGLKQAARVGGPEVGYLALFFLFCSVGAKADIAALVEAPEYVIAGIITLSVHLLVLISVMKLFRIPVFFAAVGSLANIGGAISAPIAAAAYRPALAPIGALLGVAGYIVGIYVPLFIAYVLNAMAP